MRPILAFCSLLALVSAGPAQYFREEFGDGGETPCSVDRAEVAVAVVLGWGEEFNGVQTGRGSVGRLNFFRAPILRL